MFLIVYFPLHNLHSLEYCAILIWSASQQSGGDTDLILTKTVVLLLNAWSVTSTGSTISNSNTTNSKTLHSSPSDTYWSWRFSSWLMHCTLPCRISSISKTPNGFRRIGPRVMLVNFTFSFPETWDQAIISHTVFNEHLLGFHAYVGSDVRFLAWINVARCFGYFGYFCEQNCPWTNYIDFKNVLICGI